MKKLEIGALKLKNPLILAPMLDITNLPFRLLCRKAGCSLAFTEMIYSSAITHKNKKTLEMMKTTKKDSPLGIQIAANTLKEFESTLPYLKPYDIIDINCGCPSNKIMGNQAGAYLLKNPKKIAKIVKALKKSKKPVTAKIRLGFKKNNVIKTAKLIEKAGANAITIHPRLASQDYNIRADWKWIKKVKNTVGIPVIGNGDILTEEDAAKMLDIADGAMIARAAIGDPFIFERVQYYLKTGKKKEFDFKKNIGAFQKYIDLSEKYKLTHLAKIKYLGAKFIRNIPKATDYRKKIMQLNSITKIKSLIKQIN